MTVRGNLVSMVVGGGLLMGAYSNGFHNDEVKYHKNEIRRYEKMLEVNDEAVKQRREEIMSPERVVEIRELINENNEEAKDYHDKSLGTFLMSLYGSLSFGIGSYCLYRNLGEMNREKKKYENAEEKPKNSEESGNSKNPWDYELPEIKDTENGR